MSIRTTLRPVGPVAVLRWRTYLVIPKRHTLDWLTNVTADLSSIKTAVSRHSGMQ